MKVLSTQTANLDGRNLVILTVQSTSRVTGRRIVVREGGATVFDSGEHYNIGNAVNAFDLWVAEQRKVEPVPA